MSDWENVMKIVSKQFKCKYCSNHIATPLGYQWPQAARFIYICSHCKMPTFFDKSKQIPAPTLGNEVAGVPDDIRELYNEAREDTGISAYTSAVLVCRKLLMHIAVEQGAKVGKSFVEYVEYLSEKGFVPPKGKQWVDHIRNKGNEANHEIVFMKEKDALELIDFIELLLKFIYEFPEKFQAVTTDEAPEEEGVT